MRLASTRGCLGISISSTPSAQRALIPAACADSGSVKRRRNAPVKRSMCSKTSLFASSRARRSPRMVNVRALEDVRLLRLIRASFAAIHGIYGAPRVFLDLRETGETCSKHRVMPLMCVNEIQAVRGYRIRHSSASKPSELIPNVLKRNFDVASPNKAWVTDMEGSGMTLLLVGVLAVIRIVYGQRFLGYPRKFLASQAFKLARRSA